VSACKSDSLGTDLGQFMSTSCLSAGRVNQLLASFLDFLAAQVIFSHHGTMPNLEGILLVAQPVALRSWDHSQCYAFQPHLSTFSK